MINQDLKSKIDSLVMLRKMSGLTQEAVSKMTGVSRSNIANFERGYINNMYLYDFYLNKFGGSGNEKKQNR